MPSAEGVAPADTVRADWGAHFERFGARGTFVLLDTGTGRTHRYAPERAAERLTPASTSKLFNALVFVDRGLVADVDSMHAWDGVERSIAVWNQDHSLRTGVGNSAVWLFQRLAREVGRGGYREVFARQPYGNSTMGEPLHMAWLDGSWRVSADEQVAFVDGLRRGSLGFSPEAQATVRGITPVLASGTSPDGGTWRLLGKTGWALREGEPDLGWIVGWVERADGDWVYAMNAQATREGSPWNMAPDRLRLVQAVLRGEGLIGG